MSYLRVERAEVRSKAMIDSLLKKRKKLKNLQMEFTVAGFGLLALGWYETFQSNVSFDRVEFVVVDIQRWVNDMHYNVGGLKSPISTSFDQLQTASNVFHWKMAELQASVAMTDMNREAKYRQILSLVVRSLILFYFFIIHFRVCCDLSHIFYGNQTL